MKRFFNIVAYTLLVLALVAGFAFLFTLNEGYMGIANAAGIGAFLCLGVAGLHKSE